jgi:transcriptional regulator with XRE-family HTH domain
MTQEELGFEAGLERSYVSAVELATKDPSFTTIFKIVVALKCSMTDLFQVFEQEMASSKKEEQRRRGRPASKT